MDKAAAIEKIKKCLALSKSSNPNEAATALRQAQKLMAQHDVGEIELQLSDVSEATTGAACVDIVDWDSGLSHLVGRAFGCEVISITDRKLVGKTCRTRKTRRMNFIGLGAASEVAAYCYDVLLRQVMRDRRHHMSAQPKICKPATRVARGDAFALAWVTGVSHLVERFAGTERNTALLEAYMRERYPDTRMVRPKDRRVGRNVKDNSTSAGFSAGRRAQLERGVGGPLAQERLK